MKIKVLLPLFIVGVLIAGGVQAQTSTPEKKEVKPGVERKKHNVVYVKKVYYSGKKEHRSPAKHVRVAKRTAFYDNCKDCQKLEKKYNRHHTTKHPVKRGERA